MNAHQRRIARRLEQRAFFGTNEPRDPRLHQSGYYQNVEGVMFHAHGHNMSSETLAALGEVVNAAVKATAKLAVSWIPEDEGE